MNKSTLFSIFMILLATLFIAVMPTEAEGALYSDTVRLHILAASDSEEDQRLKLAVRDAVLEKYSERLLISENSAEARAAVSSMLPEIEELASEVILSYGYSYSVTAELCEEHYETRVYENVTLPSGVYHSLIIKIGSGEGKNWWCVMYPPLCLDVATADIPDSAYTEDEKRLVTLGGYHPRFKILELVSEAFSD